MSASSVALNPPSQYFSSLKPWAVCFQTGRPVLMYHKLGPRPAGVRLKGLYVSAPWFARQLAELRAAGYRTPAMEAALAPLPGRDARPEILLTFDDGFCNVLEHGLAPLAQNGFRAIQFLVAGLLGRSNEWEQRDGEAREALMDAAQVRDWLAAGHEIGAHTLTHPRLTRLPPAQAREEIFASKRMLEDLFGVPVEHFCYPYGDVNEAVRDLVREAGYRTAVTTALGVNGAEAEPFSLKRITARYPSRNWRTLRTWLAGLMSPQG